MEITNRKYSSDKYRYGFNGKENDNELKGEGSQQDYGMRIYDPRIAKFLSVDPIAKDYPGLTSYQFASNRPIDGVDVDGLEHAAPPFSKESYSNPFVAIEMLKKNPDYTLIRKLTNDDILAGSISIQYNLTIIGLMAGGNAWIGGSAREIIKSSLKSAIAGAVVNTGISFAKGEDGYSAAKSAVSGFFSGAVLGGAWKSSLSGIITAGFLAGETGELTNQLFDKKFGSGEVDLKQILIAGGLGAVSNLLASQVVSSINSKVSNLLQTELAKTETSAFEAGIRKGLKENFPNLSTRMLNKYVKRDIKTYRTALKKEAATLQSAIEHAIENGVDQIKDKANEKVKGKTSNKE